MPLNRRQYICSLGAAATAPSFSHTMSRPAKRPNLLFVFADQLRSMELGCYGGTQAFTPNMNRLAKEGALFSSAISTYPVCSPFRGMLMSGNMPMKNGMIVNDHLMRNPTPCIAEICKAHGYQTGYIGKWHLDGRGRSDPIPPERRLGFELWRGYEATHNYFNSNYYQQNEMTPRTWEGYDAVAQTSCACDFIEKNTGSFCLFLSWGPPHDPYLAPELYMDRFAPETIKLRENVAASSLADSMWNTCTTAVPDNFKAKRTELYRDLNDPENSAIRKWHQGYLAAIEQLDDCLGRLLSTLDQHKILDDTIVVFTSDHGDMLGSHRQVGKQMPYEEALSIPFLIRYPEKIKANTESDTLLTPIDIMPTLLSLAGLPCPPVDGLDLSGTVTRNTCKERNEALIMKMAWGGNNWIGNGNPPWRGVRTRRYTYARRSDTGEPWLLFDNQIDRQQINNLVHGPAHQDLVEQLNRRTNDLLAEYNDPEDPQLLAMRIKNERENAGQRIVHPKMFFPDQMPPGTDFRQGELV